MLYCLPIQNMHHFRYIKLLQLWQVNSGRKHTTSWIHWIRDNTLTNTHAQITKSTHTCIHTHVHAHTRACTHTCMHTNTYMHTHTCMHTRACTHMHIKHAHTNTCTTGCWNLMHAHVHAHTRMPTHTYAPPTHRFWWKITLFGSTVFSYLFRMTIDNVKLHRDPTFQRQN